MDASTDDSLKRLQAGYLQLFERYPLPMLVVDLATLRLMACNEAAAQCYGYSVQQITAMHLPDLYFEKDQPALPAYMALDTKARAKQRLWRHRGRDGRAIEVAIDTEDMHLHGLPTRMFLVQDITQERLAQRARRARLLSFPQTVQKIADGFFMLDQDARFIDVNAQAEELLQVRREYLIGKTLWERCPQVTAAPYRAQYQTVAEDKQAVSFEFFFEQQNMWLEVRAFACGEGVAAYFRDVSEQHQYSERLRQKRERLDAVVAASSEAIITVDVGGLVQTFNPGAERMFGYCSEFMLGKDVSMLLPEGLQQVPKQRSAQPVSRNDAQSVRPVKRLKGVRAGGQEIFLEGSIAEVAIGPEKALIATLRDVTDREMVDAERRAARVQLTQLARRLMSQEKDLVKRVAQALHDQLGQTTAAMRIIHESMGLLRKGKETKDFLRLDQQLGRLIDQAIRQVRMVLVDLHPPLLEEHGLAAALDNELRSRALSQKDMNFVLHVPPDVSGLRWSSTVEYGAFMIAREAIGNALRHSRATQLTLNLRGDSGRIELEVIDNGRGIAPKPETEVGHLGITGMLERAQSIGGVVTVCPVEPTGVRVRLRWDDGE